MHPHKSEIFSKTLTDSQKVNNAKSWYTEKQKMAQSTLSSSKGSSLALTFSPDWANAKIETMNNKKFIITIIILAVIVAAVSFFAVNEARKNNWNSRIQLNLKA